MHIQYSLKPETDISESALKHYPDLDLIHTVQDSD